MATDANAPYAPPRSDINRAPPPMPVAAPGAVVGAGNVLDPQLEARAMAELGHMRSREATWSFAIIWAGVTLVGLFVVGLVIGMGGGAVLAWLISRMWVSGRKQAMIDAVSLKLGIAPGLFRPDRYLID